MSPDTDMNTFFEQAIDLLVIWSIIISCDATVIVNMTAILTIHFSP